AIPFKLVLNFSPDLLLKSVFDKRKIPVNYHCYGLKKTQKPEAEFEVARDKPTIYNFLGDPKVPGSLIYTYKALFEYLKSLYENKPFDVKFRDYLSSIQNFIFLGFSYEKWYLSLMLHILEFLKETPGIQRSIHGHMISCEKNEKKHPGPSSERNGNMLTFYQNEMKVDFIEECDVQEFILQLYGACGHLGILRTQVPKPQLKEKVDKEIIKGKIDNAIKLIIEFLDKNKLEKKKNAIIRLQGNYNANKDKFQQKLIKKEDFEVEENNFKKYLLELASNFG
ncbi:MAG: hypothetical protein DWQ02_27580, partial [Bacteroidetes bacterium]